MISTVGEEGQWQSVILTPVLSDDEYRIVLTWGKTPSDLDSHLTYYQGNTQKMHVYYASKSGKLNGVEVATLDLDDITSYGPETVTITLDKTLTEGGIFKCSVHNFSNGSSITSEVLSYSGAVVRVYAGNSLQETFCVPEGNAGTVWHVFTLDKNGIHPSNTFYSSSSSMVK